MSSVTIRDVARVAGVSPGTVSRALNGSPLVSLETKLRVEQIAKELDYSPNLIARRLSIGKTLSIAVLVPFFTRPSYIERLNGVVGALTQTQYDLVIHNVETPQQRDMLFREIPRKERVDGVLILSLPPKDEELNYLEHANIPVVFIDAHHSRITTMSSIAVDDVEGGYKATQHLISLGHKKIGFIGDNIDNPFNFTSSRDRFWGYKKALLESGVPFNDKFYAEDKHERYAARRLALNMLSESDRPTAVFAASDTQAMGVLEAAKDLNISVPKELSIIGYDDIEMAEYLNLTTVRQMLFESGERGVELLLQLLENPNTPPVHEVQPTELIVRKTTAPL